jgi:hypothetical protein
MLSRLLRATYWTGLRSEVLTAASMLMTAFWHMAPCTSTTVGRRFRATYCLHYESDEPAFVLIYTAPCARKVSATWELKCLIKVSDKWWFSRAANFVNTHVLSLGVQTSCVSLEGLALHRNSVYAVSCAVSLEAVNKVVSSGVHVPVI